jgi:hypothetical protein
MHGPGTKADEVTAADVLAAFLTGATLAGRRLIAISLASPRGDAITLTTRQVMPIKPSL